MTFEEHWAKMQGTQNAAVEMGKTVVEIMKEAAESGWKSGQVALRGRAIIWAVERALKYSINRSECPQSWDAGFPGYKSQALLDAKSELPIE